MSIYKTHKILLVTALATSLFFSCTEADNVIDEVFEATTRGAVLRTVEVVSNELPIGTSDAAFAVDLEIQDVENGNLVENVEVFVSFRDNTVEDGGTDFSKAEVAVGTISRSAFEQGPILPRTSYSIGLSEMLTALALTDSNVDGGDEFLIRFELVLTDGRRFSQDTNSATITGSFFSSPFLYTATVVCPPTAPTAGTWTFETVDAYGDSWNGASLNVSIDGADPIVIANTDADGIGDGSAPNETIIYTVEVPTGSETISITFTSGAFDAEVGYTVTSASGNVILSQESYAASTPPSGVELINYCIKNF